MADPYMGYERRERLLRADCKKVRILYCKDGAQETCWHQSSQPNLHAAASLPFVQPPCTDSSEADQSVCHPYVLCSSYPVPLYGGPTPMH